MNLLDLLLRRNRAGRGQAHLVRELVDACRGQIWSRIERHVFGMDLAEARGYVRARATAPIREQATVTLSRRDAASDELRNRLVLAATERAVQVILCELVTNRFTPRRAAA